MQNEKSIPVKKKLIDYMSTHVSEFSFVGGNSKMYAFRCDHFDGLYDYILIQREFHEGTLSLIISEAATCYNKSWKAIPHFIVGSDTDIAVLITGKHRYDVDTGWHRGENNEEELYRLFDEIRMDLHTYVLKYFTECHKSINANRCMVYCNSYMQMQFKVLCDHDIYSIKQYLIHTSKAYSEYRMTCRKNKIQEEIAYFDLIPLPLCMEHWLTDIQAFLRLSELSEAKRTQILKYTTLLFRDHYQFYHMK